MEEVRAAGVEVIGIEDTGVCHMGFVKDPDGNVLILHRRYAPRGALVARAEQLERYRALPLPTTKDEHWRFTDLTGFDPDAWTANGATEIAAPPSLLDVEVAGVAHVGEGGIEIERAPEGIRFEPLPDDHELLYSLVGWDEKFAAHNAAIWKHGLLVHVPRGVVARAAALRPGRERGRGRLALLAAPDRRRAGEPLRA